MSDLVASLLEKRSAQWPFVNRDDRQPFLSELEFFKSNPTVAGMASFGDNSVVMNPLSTLSQREKQSVIANERLRLLLGDATPDIDISPLQRLLLSSTSYANNPDRSRQTILGRLVSGDPSGGAATPKQRAFLGSLASILRGQEL